MTTLLELRQEIADTLAAADLGLNLYTHIPGRMALPGAYVQAGAPYLEAGQVLGEQVARFEVITCTHTGDNGSETTALDELIEQVHIALEGAGWHVEQVSQPFTVAFNNTNGLVAAITVTTELTITTGA